MPIVELVAKKAIENNPHIGISVIDMIVLLWMYTNPYSSHRRQISSMKNVLRMTETLQDGGGSINLTDDELTQMVLSSLRRLQKKGLVYLESAGVHFIKGTLTQKGIDLIERSIRMPILRRVTSEFGNNT